MLLSKKQLSICIFFSVKNVMILRCLQASGHYVENNSLSVCWVFSCPSLLTTCLYPHFRIRWQLLTAVRVNVVKGQYVFHKLVMPVLSLLFWSSERNSGVQLSLSLYGANIAAVTQLRSNAHSRKGITTRNCFLSCVSWQKHGKSVAPGRAQSSKINSRLECELHCRYCY